MAVVIATKPRVRVKARTQPAPVVRRRVYTGARIHRVALAVGYLFCLWVGSRVSFAASVAVTEQVVRFREVLIDTMDRGLDDVEIPEEVS